MQGNTLEKLVHVCRTSGSGPLLTRYPLQNPSLMIHRILWDLPHGILWSRITYQKWNSFWHNHGLWQEDQCGPPAKPNKTDGYVKVAARFTVNVLWMGKGGFAYNEKTSSGGRCC